MQKLNLKKIFLYLLISSISISAILGIAIILLGDFGEIELKVLLTTLVISCMSILGLACGASIDSGRGKILPFAGIFSAIISGIVWIILIWVERESGEFFAKFVMTITVLAIALSHLSLISLARLDKKFSWAIFAVFGAVIALVGLILALIWVTQTFESEITFRLLGVLSIITSALTIIIPIFHKLSDNLDETEMIDAEIEKLKTRLAELEKRKETMVNG